MRILLLVVLLAASGCAQLGEAATQPGTDNRCVTGMGFEFCYFRERTVVQPSESEND